MTDEKLKLSDWLIASDIDGTLNNKIRHLPKRNYDAIQKYVYDLGGHFILSSGRSVESMRKHFQRLNLNSGYAVFINGAGIYDYANEKILWMSPISEKVSALIIDAARKFKTASVQIVTPETVYLVKPTLPAKILARTSKLTLKKLETIDEVPTGNWCKAIFVGSPWTINKVEKYVAEQGGKTTNLMKSSACSFEVVNEDTNKGVAVMKVAEILGIDKSKTAAIGDYFNDYQMLKSVALPACCGQAPRGIKKISKLITCHCNKGAVADLIEYIVANY